MSPVAFGIGPFTDYGPDCASQNYNCLASLYDVAEYDSWDYDPVTNTGTNLGIQNSNTSRVDRSMIGSYYGDRAAQPTDTCIGNPQTQTFNVGDTVQLGDLHITVNGARGSRGDDFWTPDEGNYFVYVDVTFRNDGDESELVSTLFQMELRDAEGFSYSMDFGAASISGKPTPDGEIAPGGTLRGEVSYQIPVSSIGLTWRFSGDIFRLGQAVFALGTVPAPPPPLQAIASTIL